MSIKNTNTKTVLVTRSLLHAGNFTNPLENSLWRAVGCPSIDIVTHPHFSMGNILSSFYDWIIFSSRYAVKILFEELKSRGNLEFFLKAKRICAVGPETAKVIQSYGVTVDLIPDTFTAQGIVSAFTKRKIHNQTILLPMGDRSCNWLARQLDSLSNQCTPMMVYKNNAPRTIPDEVREKIASRGFSCIAVTSPSAIINLISHCTESEWNNLRSTPVISIGPTTTSMCLQLGMEITAESSICTMKGLANTLLSDTHFLLETP